MQVGWSETQPNITIKFYVGLRDRCTQPTKLQNYGSQGRRGLLTFFLV
ncbi:MAG: hypothetical protein V7L31_05610 [Nostoc sp.]